MIVKLKTILLICSISLYSVDCLQNDSDSSKARSFQNFNSFCGQSDDFFRCIKVQALKITDSMLSKSSIKLLDGVQIINSNDLSRRQFPRHSSSLTDLSKLSNGEIDAALLENVQNVFSSQSLQVNIPRLLTVGLEDGKKIIEARGKKYKKYLGPFVAALAIKGGILTMVYHSIAIIAGMFESTILARKQVQLLFFCEISNTLVILFRIFHQS